MPTFLRLILFFSVPVVLYYFIHRRTHKNAPIGGAFFFDMDSLVLNTGIPYAIPFDDIDFVTLRYNPWELEHQFTYGVWIKVTRKSGQTKRIFYKGSQTGTSGTPFDMRDALEDKGLRVVMEDGGRE